MAGIVAPISSIHAKTEREETWFELDMIATCPEKNNDTELLFLIECKYHDASRFWFFLPHEPDRWYFDDRVLNCGPLQTLANPAQKTFIELAPSSVWGIVVSEDGMKQDNTVHTAIQQVLNGFVPYCLFNMFSYNIDFRNSTLEETRFVPDVTALIPMIVTNASIFRLKPDVSDLEKIRHAESPHEVADEVSWTWCCIDPSMSLINQNWEAIDKHKEEEAELIYRFPFVKQRLDDFDDRPNWIAVVNIKSLSQVSATLAEHFLSLPTLSVKDILNAKSRRTRH